MTDVRVDSFPIPGLEYVFVPPGVPLVTKSAQSDGTTSILIRGGAGTGKTTLAVALAHAISRKQAGVALYLTTEFVATEIVYKAAVLQLPEGSTASWDSPTASEAGTILARHLLQTRAGADEQKLRTVGARKHAAIEAIWESLANSEGEPSASRPIGPPVRAVVIDAFGLPEIDDEDNLLRNELLTLVQSLERIGVTVILVEEASVRTEAWLPFVVDIVFEAELSPDPDAGELLRRLKCPKSRYGQALPGPHDYGLDVSLRPAVWPDLAFSNTWAPLRRETNQAPTFLVPQGDRFGLYPAGSVLISNWSDKRPFLDAFSSLPGIKDAHILCGPLSTVAFDGERAHVGQGQGIFAIVWMLIYAYHAERINAVEIVNFDFFLARPQTRTRSLRALAMLSASGLSVCLHGNLETLKPAFVVADCVQGGKHRKTHETLRPRLCRADRWLPHFASSKKLDGNLVQVLEAHYSGLLEYARRKAEGLIPLDAARFLMIIGDGLAAAPLIQRTPRHPEFRRMWASLAAIHAGNTAATDALEKDSATLDADDMISLLRALAANQHRERLDATIELCRTRFDLPSWYVERLRAELPVDSETRERLVELSSLEELPTEHRAEVWYNISVIETLRGDQAAAQAAQERAVELNPELDVAHGP